ncbi:RNA polymerase sigma-70 factor [Runella slithyformis]|uniref:RNA polymerase, sigma-24 subunit, ECF subfamily n=1 Tax=Runella slithyformis (strain ATCC 29530 / DSM 19594 / LMG 11500 / NCIMB 11436 / LSU 4) TaxID=761193 RepID=A0A7U4E7M6_RUNSL|nr:RNA polymerase sigma-70 factor [Runella slithyformis]AEI50544.1 RNA polymerase, sigma-24 subunit, ECF subfamily [Runella slithyformis DSM 19594]
MPSTDANEPNSLRAEECSSFIPSLKENPDGIIDSEVWIKKAFEVDTAKGYELLFKRYYPPLCSHAVRFVYSKEVAEDLVMEVFSQFWQKQLHQIVTASYRAYLFTTVRHAAFAYLRTELKAEKSADYSIDVSSDTPPVTPQQILQYNELYIKIEEIVRSASPQSQKVFVMSRFEGKKNAAIAEELHLSTKTVEGHITKVLSLLRQSLRNYGLLVTLLVSGPVSQGKEFLSIFLSSWS